MEQQAMPRFVELPFPHVEIRSPLDAENVEFCEAGSAEGASDCGEWGYGYDGL